MKHRLLMLGLVALMIVASLVILIQPQDHDPLKDLIQPDGSIRIPGGKFDPEQFRQILDRLFAPPPKPYTEIVYWLPKQSSYATTELESHTFQVLNLGIYSRSPAASPSGAKPSDLINTFVDGARWFFSLDWLIGHASAAFATKGSWLTNSDGVAATTQCFALNTTLAVNDLAVLVMAKDETDTGTVDGDSAQVTAIVTATGGVTDGNIWIKAVEFANKQTATAANGAIVAIWWSHITVAVNSGGTCPATGGTITVTYSASTTAEAMTGWAFTTGNNGIKVAPSATCSAGTAQTLAAGTACILANDAADAGAVTMASLASVEHLNIRGGGIEGLTTTYTVSTNFTTFTHTSSTFSSGTAATSMAARGEFRIVTSTGETTNPTTSANDQASALIAFVECNTTARFWVGTAALGTGTGTGNWNNPAMWSDVSAGARGCLAPTSSMTVAFDASSSTAAATITVNAAAAMSSFTDSGFNDASSSIALGANSWTNGGAETHATTQLPFSCSTNGGSISIAGTLTLSGGNIACATSTTTGSVAAVNISAVGSFIDFGSGAWSVSGTWTNATTSASWDAGTATVTFTAAAGGTMTFAGANLAEAEFNSATFTSSAASPQTFTMATRGIRWLSTLSVTDASSTTALATADLAFGNSADTPDLGVGNGGTLTANASAVTLATVTMTGGTTGTITVTTGVWTLAGTWNTSGAGSVFTEGSTSTYEFNATATITLLSTDNTFSALTVSAGTVTLATNTVVTNTLTVSGGTFAKSTFTITAAALTMSGGDLTSTSGTATINGAVNISSASSAITFGSETWNISGTWTNASTDGAVWAAGTATVNFTSATGGTMTFAGANLSEDEFNIVNFTSSAGTAQVFTMSTRGLRATTINVNDGSSTTALDTSVGNLAVTATTLNVTTGGILTANASTITVTSIDTSTGTYTVGISTVVIAASGGTVNIDETANNLTVNSGISTTFAASFTWSGTFTATSAGTLTFGASSLTSSGAATMTFASATITMSTGFWDTSSATTFTATSSSVTFSGNGNLTIGASHTFATVVVSGGTRTLLSQLSATVLTLSGGTFAKGTNALTVSFGDLTMSGGDLTSTSGTVSITGNVNISSASSAIDFGSESWTITGTWTNASTDGTVWDAGTGTVTFTNGTGGTMTFAGANLAEAEFNNAEFSSSAGTPQTFTMSTRALRWGTTLTISDASSTTELATSDLGLTTGAISVGNGGILTANASTVSITSFTMTGGSSGVLTLTTGDWTLSGNWNSSGAGSLFTQGSSTVTMSGTGTSITLRSGDSAFNNLTISAAGTVTLASEMTVAGTLTVNSGAALALATFVVVITTLAAVAGGITAGASGSKTVNSNVTVNAAGYFSFGSAPWEFTGTWTNNSTSASWDKGGATVLFSSATGGTMTFGDTTNYVGGVEFSSVTFTSSAGAPQTFTMATNALKASGTLTVTDGSSTTTLTSSNLNLQANDMECGTNGIINIGTGDFKSIVTFNIDGSLTMNGITVSNMYINRTAGSGTIDITAWTAWAVGADVDVRWTFSPSVAGDTWEFVLEDVTATTSYDLLRNTITIDTQTSVATTITLSGIGGWAAGDAMAIDETPLPGCSVTCYWFGGTGNWSDGTHWGDASGGGNSGVIPTAASTVIFDANSGAGTVTVDVSATMASFDSTGSSITTIAIGTQTFEVNGGSVTHAAGTITISTGVFNAGATSITSAITASGAATFTLTTLTVGIGGTFTANAATVAATNVTMTSAVSGTITLTSGSWAVSGNWDTSGSGTTFTKGTSTVTMSGTSKTVTIRNSSNGFYNLTTSGTVSQVGAIDVSNTLDVTGTLTTAGFNITGSAALVFSGGIGTLAMTTSTVTFGAVTAAGIITLSAGTFNGGAFIETGTTTASGAAVFVLTSLDVNTAGIFTANAATVTVGNVTMTSAVSGTITLTSGLWAVSGNWDTSGSGTTFTKGSSTITMSGAAKAVAIRNSGNGFYNLTLSGTISQTTAIDVSNALAISGSGVLTTSDNNITGGAAVSLIGTGGITGSTSSIAVGAVTVGSGTTLSMTSGTITVSGNWDSSLGTFTYGTSTVVFAASGTVTTPNVLSTRYFYNFTVNVGVTTTMASHNGVANIFTANGTLASQGGDAQRVFMVFGDGGTANPVVVGGSGDLSGSGYFVYRIAQNFNVVGTVYQHLAVEGSSGVVATLAGNISTPLCGVYNACAIIFLTFVPSTTFTVNTGDFNITAGGQFWLGDGGGFGVTFNAGASTIVAYGFTPAGNNTVVNLQTSVVTSHPSSSDTNLCFSTSGTQVTNFGSSTFNCYGQFRLASGYIDAGSANINVIHDGACIPSPDCGTDDPGSRSPGEVVIFDGTYIIFGTSTWSVDSLWQNSNTSAQANWDAGTATVTFHQTGVNTNYNFGGTTLGEAEFYNAIFDFDELAGDTTITMVTDSLWVANVMTVRDTSGGTTTVSTLGLAVNAGSLVVGNGGILNAAASSVTVGDVTMTGAASGTITLTGALWTVSGNWDTSGTGTTFTKGTSTITMSGSGKTLAILNSSNGFNILVVTGTITEASAITASTLTISAGSLTKSTFALTVNGNLTMSGGDLLSTSGAVTVTGNVNISSASSAISFGSETWTISGTWSNSSTDSATWNQGTATVKLVSTGATSYAAGNLGEAEFYNLIFDTTTAVGTWDNTFTMPAAYIVGNDLTFASTGGAFFRTNLTGASVAMTVGNDVVGNGSAIIMNISTLTLSGDWNFASPSEQWAGGSRVVFSGTTQSIDVNSGQSHIHFYDMTVSVGSTTTYNTTPTSIYDSLTVNGTLKGGGTFTRLELYGYNSATPLIMGGSGDVSQNGIFQYAFDSAGGITTHYVTGAIYHYLSISVTTTGETARLAGNIETSACAPNYNECAILISGWDIGQRAVFYTDNFSIHSRGVLWFGDLDVRHVDAYLGSSTITTDGGFDVIGYSNVYFETANITMNAPSGGYTPEIQAFAMEYNGTAYGGSSTVTVNGNFRMNDAGGELVILHAQSMNITISGYVLVEEFDNYIDWGSSVWSVGGTWTNASTSALWSAGTSSVTFTSSSSISFDQGDSTNYVGAVAFNSLAFQSSSGLARTFTLSTHALLISGTLTISDSSSTTELATTNLGITMGPLVVGTGGILTANASTVVVSNVTMVSATSGTITLTSGSWAVSGNWNTSGAGSIFTQGTSTVTMAGAGKTINMLAGDNAFANLTITGTVSLLVSVQADLALMVPTGGALTKTGFSIGFNALTVSGSGSVVDGAVTVIRFTVTNDEGSAITTISSFTAWAINGTSSWTHTSSSATTTITFTLGDNTTTGTFTVTKYATPYTSGIVDGSGNVVFTMLGSDPDIIVVVIPPGDPPDDGGMQRAELLIEQIGEFTFRFTVVPLNGSIVSVVWNFGDGTSLDGSKVVTHTYTSIGIYLVSATATFKAGNQQISLAKIVRVHSELMPIGPAFVAIVGVLALLTMLISGREWLRIKLGTAAVVLLGLQVIPYFRFFDYNFAASVLFFGMAGLSAALAFLPSKKSRPRGLWLILGAVAVVLALVITFTL